VVEMLGFAKDISVRFCGAVLALGLAGAAVPASET
jgi:hypothetical protein